MHHRLRPVRHRFTYRVLSLYLDLDELGGLDHGLRLFSAERANLLSFRNADHGPRDGSPLKPWVLARLRSEGIELRHPRVALLCFPRVLGFVFNPLSVYFCHDGGERGPTALLYEVRNTFGEQHTYAFRVHPSRTPGRLARHGCAKTFYVSPFVGMGARYQFMVDEPSDRLALLIKTGDPQAPTLLASQIGRRRPLDDRAILRCVAGDLFVTFKVFLGIHAEALRLWRKGVPVFPREHRPSPGPGRG